jgi:hypothetical protein
MKFKIKVVWILTIHKEILPLVNKTPIHLSEISKAFQNLEKMMKLHYCNYFEEYDERVQYTAELEMSSPKFYTKLQQFSDSNNYMHLQSLVILPIGRIPRLRLIFRELLKNCFEEGIKVEISKILKVLENIQNSYKN